MSIHTDRIHLLKSDIRAPLMVWPAVWRIIAQYRQNAQKK